MKQNGRVAGQLVIVALAMGLAAAVSAPMGATGRPPSRDVAEPPDLRATMELFDIDERTARANMAVRERLDEVLSGELMEGYAGATVDYRGDFNVDYYFTRSAPTALIQSLTEHGLASHARFHTVAYSMRELSALQAKLVRPGSGLRASPDVDVAANRVRLNASSKAEARELARLGLTARERAAVVANVAPDEVTSTLGGGGSMSTCTSGFVVKKVSNGNLGISTAGHCGNSQWLAGTSLTFKGELYGGQYDFQWHDASGMGWTNTVSDGIADSTPYFRYITDRRSESNQFVGDPVCKTGKVSGYDCGTLSSKLQCPDPDLPNRVCNFHRVHKPNTSLSQGGDSGGPVYYNNTALGLIHGGVGDDLIYMPQNRLGQLDLAVILS